MLGDGSLKKRPSSPAPQDEIGEEESLLQLGTEYSPCHKQATTCVERREQENLLRSAVQACSARKVFHLSQFANLSYT